MNTNEFVSGVLKDPEDPRDHMVASIYSQLGVVTGGYPPTLDLRPNLPPVRNQGARGTCAAFTAVTIKEWQEKTDSGYTGLMSPEFVYFFRKNKPNAGMFSRDVMDILLKYGCCAEVELPYNPPQCTRTIFNSTHRSRIS